MGYYIDDPNGGDPIYIEGDNPAMGNTGRGTHTPWTTHAGRIAKYLAVPLGVAGLDAVVNPALQSAAPIGGSVAPAAPSAAGGLNPMAGVSFLGPTAPAGTVAGTAPAAVAPSVAAAGAKTMMSPWLKAGLELGSSVGANLINRQIANAGVNSAQQAQQAATREALERVGAAQTSNGEIYNQQRQDFQNLANAPYQTLGSLLGMNIPAIGPVNLSAGQVATSPHSMGQIREPMTSRIREGQNAAPGSGLGPPGTEIAPFDPRTAVPTPPDVRANLQTLSGYGSDRSGNLVPVRLPNGRTVMVPADAARMRS